MVVSCVKLSGSKVQWSPEFLFHTKNHQTEFPYLPTYGRIIHSLAGDVIAILQQQDIFRIFCDTF